MGFFEDLDTDIERQEEEMKEIPVFETVTPLPKLAPTEQDTTVKDVIAVELCVYSVETHSRGWRYVLIDKEAASGFPKALEKMNSLKREYKDAKIFRITMWQPKKHQHESQVRKPGTISISIHVTDFSNYKGVMPQAETAFEAMIKAEQFMPDTKKSKLA